MPNIFSGTCFKKHQGFLVEQQKHSPFFLLTLHYRSLSRHKSVQGKLFFASYWLSLHMKILDCIQKREDFMPVDLGSRNLEFVQRFFKEAVEFSHSNIVRNANNLLMALPHDNVKNIAWLGAVKQRVNSRKFKLNY